jgi:hypothetical protein
VPNWLAERLDAQNIHDGGQTHGTYDETYYRYLNLGLRVPFSTGTDWFVYDFSRVYVPLQTERTPQAWLRELAAGRTFITNGPLLELTLGEHRVGDVIKLDAPTTLKAHGRGLGRSDFAGLELVRNGEIVVRAKSQATGNHFEATLDAELTIDAPGWYALRIPLEQGKNELDQKLFAHTSPIYVDFQGRRVFDLAAAEACRSELERALDEIPKQGKFADDAERERVLAVYRDGLVTLEKRIAASRGLQ